MERQSLSIIIRWIQLNPSFVFCFFFLQKFNFLSAREFRTSLRAYSIVNQKIPKGSSYHEDTDSYWMSGLAEASKIAKASRTTNEDDDVEFFEMPDQNEDFEVDEEFSFTYVIGTILVKDICVHAFCEVCQKVLLSDKPLEAHSLIEKREYVTGEQHLTYPSELAIKLFTKIEELFQANEDKIVGPTQVIDNLSKQGAKLVSAALPEVPTCHLFSMVRRYINTRLGRFLSKKTAALRASQKTSVDGIKHASKSAAGHALK